MITLYLTGLNLAGYSNAMLLFSDANTQELPHHISTE
jgi:hypothetical protein